MNIEHNKTLPEDSPQPQSNLDHPHLVYDPPPEVASLHVKRVSKLVDLIKTAADLEGSAYQDFEVLDIGSGRGELMQHLSAAGFAAVQGIDIDPTCVQLSSRYGKCRQLGIENLQETFGDKNFDLVAMSHVLEHMRDPLAAVKTLRKTSRRWILLAVPNPMCPLAIYKSIRRKPWSNETHVVVWDRSHFRFFLTRHADLKLVEETGDYVQVFHGQMRKRLFQVGLNRTMKWVEQGMLYTLFPHFATSIITLCEI
jgi:SAM-dependent methyltransferase